MERLRKEDLPIRSIVTDFDNTVTIEKGLEPFFASYRDTFCKTLGIEDRTAYEVVLGEILQQMEDDPLKYGWKSNGFFSAPVRGDPIGTNTVAHINLMNRMIAGDIDLGTRVLRPEEVDVIKETCYGAAYAKRKTHFPPSADVYLAALENLAMERAIMSNSGESSIRRKIEEGLTLDHSAIPVIGHAKKMIVGSDEGSITPPGFPVPIHPNRPEYLAKLRAFEPELERLAVVGDNFFLDVAPVLLHGGYGILLETEATQGYEVPFLQEHPRGYFAKDHMDVLTILAEIQADGRSSVSW